MARRARYIPDPTFEAKLAAAPETVALLGERCERAKRAAEHFAPRGRGRYRRNLAVALVGHEPRIVTGSSFWHFVEYGSVHNAPWAPLRKAVESIGARFKDPA